MKTLLILAALTFSIIARADQSCQVTDEDGSTDIACASSGRPIRCYADVKYDDGSTARIWSGDSGSGVGLTCVSDYSGCWSVVSPDCE